MSDSEDSDFSDNQSERSSEAEEVEENEEEEEQGSVAGSDKAEEEGEDLEDEEEYDEEEEEDDDRPRKKARHGGFILDEADVDDEYEDEDPWEDGAEDILEKEEAEVSNLDHVVLDEDHSGSRRLQNLWRDSREEALGEYYMRKYAKSSGGEHFYGGSEDLSDDITQQQLLPGVKDPNLWTVKCKIGEERATAISLMRKFVAYQCTDTPLQIKSVVAPEHVKGYIYVEAYKQTHVKAAIEGVGNLRMGFWNQQMVPIKEMTDVLKVVKEVTNLKPKSWVRLKRGLYKDDIAQVDYVEPSQNTISLKMIPRIDLDRIKARMSMKDWFAKRKKFKRPPQRLFDAEKIRSLGGEVSHDGDFMIFEANRYSRKGFLFKSFAMSAVITEGVKPTLSELEKFEDQPEGIDLEVVTETTGKEREHNLQAGDNVEVCEGELINLQGKILSVDGNKITIMPKHEDLKDPLEFPAHELRKYFRMGDHVKVIAGRYEGDTGLIVRVEENFVILFSDLTMHELKVLPRDLQLCSETASGVDAGGQHEWGELVQLDPQTVGVIVRLERETFQVLNMHGKVLTVRHQAVNRRKDNRFAVALDSEQNNIHVKDIVKVIDDEYEFAYDDEPSPSPQGYGGTPNPQTPGYPEVPSPQVNPQYNPQTPGTPAMYNTDQYSPYAAPSPQGSYQPSPSPQSYHQVAPSPVGYQNTHSPASYHPTPSPMAYQASPSPSPVGYSPMTPGAPSPGGYNPHTPGSNIDQASNDWVTTDIMVRVKDTFLDGGVINQTGIIRSVTGGMCSVFLQDTEKVVSISSEHLEPVTPTKNNKVKVILGEDREATGVLLSIDGEDGIVRMELDEQLKILNLRFLGKLEV
uniref:Isoform 2 of Transcription elongation factor SPT5 n=1 Tax=Danio rerio TaxID=7955 RepID=Q9DDT5-2|nr:Supt5h protein [Danio rerio]